MASAVEKASGTSCCGALIAPCVRKYITLDYQDYIIEDYRVYINFLNKKTKFRSDSHAYNRNCRYHVCAL